MSELLPARAPKRKLALRPYARAVAQVLRVSFRASPAAVVMKVLGSLISALLPLVTTYFAALTTTALAAAYAGDADAGQQADRLRHHHRGTRALLGRVQQRGPLHPAAHELQGRRDRG